jgi:plastocyanin
MQLTTAQLQTLKNDINANTDPEFAAFRTAGNAGQMAEWYNVDSTFIVFKPTELTTSIGDVISYVAVAALTDANVNKLNLFYTTQPSNFEPAHADQRQYLADVFSGALGGAGQATRDALDALYRRAALKGEKLYCTGTGTTVAPGALNATAQGDITTQNILDAQALP